MCSHGNTKYVSFKSDDDDDNYVAETGLSG